MTCGRWIAFAFGFIHGFGFASVLARDGPARRGRSAGRSFSFNVGVEIGQLLVVVIVATALLALRSRSEAAGRRLAFAGSVVVMAAGAFWFVQRVFFPGGSRMRRWHRAGCPDRGRCAVAWRCRRSRAPANGPKVVEVEKLKDNLYVLKGGGGNTAVFVTADRRHCRRHEEPGLGPADPRQDQGADAASRSR